jgi:hypothetical protein
MTAEDLSAAAGVLLSLGFSYIPGLNQRYSSLEPAARRLVMLGLLILVTLGTFGLSCLGLYPADGPSCDRAGAWGLLRLLATAAIANQCTFALSPRPDRNNQRQVHQESI